MAFKRTGCAMLSAGVLVLAGCGSDGGGGGASGAEASTKVRMAHVFPASSVIHEAAEKFADDVAEATDDSLKVTVYPSGQLGGDVEMGEALVNGSLDCAFINHPAAGMDERLQLGFLPYIVTSYEGADALFYGDGVIAQHDRKILDELGVHALEFYENDFRGLTNSVREITSPEDLQGLKIRVPELPMYVDLFKAWGAQPLPIAFPELYTALQQGTVDGQDNGVILTFDSKFQEVQKYFTRTNHAYGAGVIACSQKLWDSLSAEQQEALTSAAEAASEQQVADNRATVEEKLQGLKDAGIKVTEPTAEQIERFKAASDKVWKQNADVFGQDVLDEVRAAAEEAEGK
jgi:tripartite ATP-independent transporter DctP family solute receptor